MNTWLEQGLQAKQTGQLNQAEQFLWQALAGDSQCAEAYFHLAELSQAKQELNMALALYDKALALQPQWPEIFNNLGVIAALQGQTYMASDYFLQAVTLQPQDAGFQHNLALALVQIGETQQALHHGLEALRLAPEWEAHFYQQALSFLDQHIYAGAEFYLTLLIEYAGTYRHHALRKMGFTLQQEGRTQVAQQVYYQAMALMPNFQTRLSTALLLPPIYQNTLELLEWRTRFVQGLTQLEQGPPPTDEAELSDLDLSWFYLAYQGYNERDTMKRLAHLCLPAVPELVYPQQSRPSDSRVRLGFVSRFFSNHPVAQCFGGLLKACESDRFAVTLFCLPGSQPVADAPVAHQQLMLPAQLAEARQIIANQNLDILVYTDIGLEPFSWLLGLTRLAPVQCVLSGHPLTTGLPAMDYFISSRLLEAEDAQAHYTEKLLLLPHPPVAFAVPAFAGVTASMPLPPGHIYLCPTTLYKIHPDFDTALQGILQQDPLAQMVFFQDPYRPFAALLQQRWLQTLTMGHERLHVLPWVSAAEFYQLLQQAHVILDPFHFGMGTTAYLALAAGTPVVTWPAPYLRGRSAFGLCHHLGLTDSIASEQGHYVQQACQLAQDSARREHWQHQWQQQRAHLCEQKSGIQALLDFWEQVRP